MCEKFMEDLISVAHCTRSALALASSSDSRPGEFCRSAVRCALGRSVAKCFRNASWQPRRSGSPFARFATLESGELSPRWAPACIRCAACVRCLTCNVLDVKVEESTLTIAHDVVGAVEKSWYRSFEQLHELWQLLGDTDEEVAVEQIALGLLESPSTTGLPIRVSVGLIKNSSIPAGGCVTAEERHLQPEAFRCTAAAVLQNALIECLENVSRSSH